MAAMCDSPTGDMITTATPATMQKFDPIGVCPIEGCGKSTAVKCGCGDFWIHHGRCPEHLVEAGWVPPEDGQCWTHPEYTPLIKLMGWRVNDYWVKFFLHNIRYIDRSKYIKPDEKGRPMCIVAWSCVGSSVVNYPGFVRRIQTFPYSNRALFLDPTPTESN